MNEIKDKFIYIAKKRVYEQLINAPADDNPNRNVISQNAIVFVEDEGAIYTHGHRFGGGSQTNESQQNNPLPSEDSSDDSGIIYYGFVSQTRQQRSMQFTTNPFNLEISLETPGDYFYIMMPNEWKLDDIVMVPGFGLVNMSESDHTIDGKLYRRYQSVDPLSPMSYTYQITLKKA